MSLSFGKKIEPKAPDTVWSDIRALRRDLDALMRTLSGRVGRGVVTHEAHPSFGLAYAELEKGRMLLGYALGEVAQNPYAPSLHARGRGERVVGDPTDTSDEAEPLSDETLELLDQTRAVLQGHVQRAKAAHFAVPDAGCGDHAHWATVYLEHAVVALTLSRGYLGICLREEVERC